MTQLETCVVEDALKLLLVECKLKLSMVPGCPVAIKQIEVATKLLPKLKPVIQ